LNIVPQPALNNPAARLAGPTLFSTTQRTRSLAVIGCGVSLELMPKLPTEAVCPKARTAGAKKKRKRERPTLYR